jgi:hypothetical protein
VNLVRVVVWVGWEILLVCGCGEGMVHVPCYGLWRRLCCSALDSFLGFLGVWAISGDVPLFFSMKETVLLTLSLLWIPALVFPLVITSALVLLLS